MENKHTLGPWVAHAQGEANNYALILEAGKWLAAIQFNGELLEQTQNANARLIAAAPAMLKALHRITHPAADESDLEFALQVIDQATGGGQ